MAVKYQSYPEYKDSGITWMGNVPKHWGAVRFKHVLSEKKKTSNHDLNAGSISFGKVVYKDAENLSPETKASYQEVLVDEFLINPLNMNYDLLSLRTALSSINVVVSTGYIVLKSNESLIKRYIRWLLQEFDVAHMKTLGSGVRQTINYADISNSYFFEPSIKEQERIAKFLDYETVKIDTLIEKQQKLIKLLKEKRQAVISHVVTKGLNPNAPMRDSGVEWLGKVPEHWSVAKVKYFSSIQGGFAFNSDSFQDYGVQLLRIGNVYLNNLCLERQPIFVDESYVKTHKDFSVRRGDILMSLTGTLGKTDYGFAVHVDEDGPFMLNQRVAKITPIESKIKSEYLIYAIRSESYLKQLYSLPSGTKQANLSNDDVTNIPIVVPPTIDEQLLVAHYISKNLKRYNRLINKCETAIEIIQERRTALISAAVTGKIDVRNWQTPDSSNTANNNNKEVAV